MILLSLDQSLVTTGYAVYDDSTLIAYSHFTIPSNLSLQERLEKIYDKIQELIKQYNITHIVMEDIQLQHGNAATYKKLAYVQAAIIFAANANKIVVSINLLGSTQWRSILTNYYQIKFGKIREEQKRNTLNFVENHFKIHTTEDEADAIAIGLAEKIKIENNKSDF